MCVAGPASAAVRVVSRRTEHGLHAHRVPRAVICMGATDPRRPRHPQDQRSMPPARARWPSSCPIPIKVDPRRPADDRRAGGQREREPPVTYADINRRRPSCVRSAQTESDAWVARCSPARVQRFRRSHARRIAANHTAEKGQDRSMQREISHAPRMSARRCAGAMQGRRPSRSHLQSHRLRRHPA